MKQTPPQQAGPFELKSGSQRQRVTAPEHSHSSSGDKGGKCTVVSLEERRRNVSSPGASHSSRPHAYPAEDMVDEDGRPAAEPPNRNYDCKHYETCLDLAASLNWSSFTCQGCSGEVNSALLWRAHQNQRKDSVAKALCDLKPIEQVAGLKPTVECIGTPDREDSTLTVETQESSPSPLSNNKPPSL